jgi:hypothetical protein
VPHGRSGIKGQKAGRNLERQWFADLSMFPGRKEKATGSWMIADPLDMNRGSPHWHPAIQRIRKARTSQDCGSSTA